MDGAAPRSVEWVEHWKNSGTSPYVFAVGVLGFLPYGVPNPDKYPKQLEKWQDEFLRNFCKPPFRHTVRAGHGVGKDVVIAILALWFVTTHYDSKCVVTASSDNQLRDTTWPELKKWSRELPPDLAAMIEIQEERINLRAAPEMAFVVRRVASKSTPEAMQGFHAPHMLFLINEASGMPDVVFEVAAGALSSEGAMCAMFSNPTKATGFFHSTHTKLRDRWKSWVVNCEDVPRARSHIDDVIAEYGKNSNRYRVRVLGEFPTKDDDTVIPLEIVEAAQKRSVVPMRVKPIWGVDVARFGDDKSVLCKRQGNVLLEPPKHWEDLDGVQLAERIGAEWKDTPQELRPSQINVDVIGYGASCHDHLYRVLKLPSYGINVAESASNDDKYRRLRDELWFKAQGWFKEMDCSIPKEGCERLVSDLTAPTYDFADNGKRVVESKKDLKKRGLPSCDYADAFCLSLLGIPESLPMESNVDWGDDHGGGSGWTG